MRFSYKNLREINAKKPLWKNIYLDFQQLMFFVGFVGNVGKKNRGFEQKEEN